MEQQGLPEEIRKLPGMHCLVTGVGPVESAISLTEYLVKRAERPKLVLNFGVGGAYPASDLGLLDLCLAESEVLGDLGVETAEGLQPLPEAVRPLQRFAVDLQLLDRAEKALLSIGYEVRRGPFVTLCCSTGTTYRGRMLRETHGGICENMEGAAVARVCSHYGLPFLELRCISNLVEDRDTAAWRLKDAALKAAQCAGLLAADL